MSKVLIFGCLILLSVAGCTPVQLVQFQGKVADLTDDLGDRWKDSMIQNWKARERIREECWDSVKRTIDEYREKGDEEGLRKFLISVYPPLNISGYLEQGLDYTRTPQLCGDQAEPEKN